MMEEHRSNTVPSICIYIETLPLNMLTERIVRNADACLILKCKNQCFGQPQYLTRAQHIRSATTRHLSAPLLVELAPLFLTQPPHLCLHGLRAAFGLRNNGSDAFANAASDTDESE